MCNTATFEKDISLKFVIIFQILQAHLFSIFNMFQT